MELLRALVGILMTAAYQVGKYHEGHQRSILPTASSTAEAISGDATPTGIREGSPATQRREDLDRPFPGKCDGEDEVMATKSLVV
jgi:hypothetical protein